MTVALLADLPRHDAAPGVADSRRHYERVETELLSADTSGLTPTQLRQRTRAIAELREYRERGDFGRATEFPGARVPYFVDSEGRRCAVAQLLHEFGRDDLVAAVRETDNHAYVSDLADNGELVAWLDSVGLTVEEAARIQGPVPIPDPDPDWEGDLPEDDPVPDAPGRGAAPATSGSDVPGARAGVQDRIRQLGDRGGFAATGPRSWWMWWELNKLDYIRPHQLRVSVAITGDEADPAKAQTAALDRRRRAVAPLLTAQLTNSDARVRASAAMALGRLAGPQAVPHLVELLADPQVTVRERAVLALGATGAPEAVEHLLRIAERGALAKRGNDEISPAARPLAVVALGLARHTGLDTDADARVAKLLQNAKKRDRADMTAAVAMHEVLVSSEPLARELARLATDDGEPTAVRTRAVESLADGRGAETLRSLQLLLEGRRVELRRSAAVALGSFDDELVAPRLMTAYEMEREPLVRGLLLLSIAERGGARAESFLAHQLAEGDQALRPWAALGLGVMGAAEGSESIRARLRETELPRAQQGALWLALGLAGDQSDVQRLDEALTAGDSERSRAYAATGLALIGGEKARFALLDRRGKEKSELVRAQIAHCVGVLGAAGDAEFVLEVLRDVRQPGLQALMAVGAAYHGSETSLDGLLAVARAERTDPAARAAAIDAIGILLDPRPDMALPKMIRRTNFAALPGWVTAIFDVTL